MMYQNRVRSTILAAAFAAAAQAGGARAQDALLYSTDTVPQDAVIDKLGNISYFTIDSRVSPEKILTTQSAMADTVTGIVCEWVSQANLDITAGYKNLLQSTRYVYQKCAQMQGIPEKWMEAGNISDIGSISSEQSRDVKFLMGHPYVVETFSARSYYSNVLSQTFRLWNMDKQEVCLQFSEGLNDAATGEYRHYLTRDAGCFPIVRDNGYYKALLESLSLKGA